MNSGTRPVPGAVKVGTRWLRILKLLKRLLLTKVRGERVAVFRGYVFGGVAGVVGGIGPVYVCLWFSSISL